ncbi:MAG TPA: TolC family protein [Blastocatellia bacterium]|nr:TolC family protein [Blastocatellia bacterium]
MATQWARRLAGVFTTSLSIIIIASVTTGQVPLTGAGRAPEGIISRPQSRATGEDALALTNLPRSTVALYVDPVQGASSSDLVRRALAANAELVATRLDIERGRARLQQAGLRPNPTFDFEQTTGRLTGSPGERETSIGFALPLELSGKRQRRIDLARVELQAAEAEIADRERRLIAEVRAGYAEALAAVRELQITEELIDIDLQTSRVIEVRVNEGDSAPLEHNLLRVEVERLRARRALIEGRLQGALLKLKSISGVPPGEALRLREELAAPDFSTPPDSVAAALDIALRTRPDLTLARLTEEAAQAGLRLARAQAAPDVTAFSKYTTNRSVFDDTPVGVLRDRDRLLSFGVSISIPLFNRNQGAKAEAEVVIAQARHRREFTEQMVRAEVASAYGRYEAAQAAINTFRQGVLDRSAQNIKAIRGAYEVGAFRVTDLLAEQRRFVDSQREFTEALTEYYRALADLQSAMGVPKP